MAPVWVGPILAVFVFVLSRWAFPWLITTTIGGSQFGASFADTLSLFAIRLAPLFAGGVILIWLSAEFKRWIDKRRLEQQTGWDSIDALDWREFESLLAEAFRRQGFIVAHTGRDAPDGGIDIRLNKAGAVTLVQCKHWRSRQVGIRVVRELLGVVVSEDAQSGIIVTSGRFTAHALEFAANNPIRLIDGRELAKVIKDTQTSGRPASIASAPTERTAAVMSVPPCPKCGSSLVQRTARRGPSAGSTFFGCSQFPKCNYTRDIGN